MVELEVRIMKYEMPKLVAEIGCNHKGDFELAKKMLKILADNGIKYAKFQKRNPKEVLTPEEYAAPHPNPANSYGRTYGEHREFLEFTLEQHMELKKYAEKLGIIYSTSVWDLTSAREIVSINPEFIKVPSACSTYWELHKVLIDNFDGMIHVSTGMTTKSEIDNIVKFYEKEGREKDLVLYHCTSGYPISYEDATLLEIARLKEKYSHIIGGVGYSGHHLGIGIDIAAYVLGAEWIERHFTLNKNWKGTDHKASLIPEEIAELNKNLHHTYRALRYKEMDFLEIEIPQALKLRWDRHQGRLREVLRKYTRGVDDV